MSSIKDTLSELENKTEIAVNYIPTKIEKEIKKWTIDTPSLLRRDYENVVKTIFSIQDSDIGLWTNLWVKIQYVSNMKQARVNYSGV